MTHDPRIGAAMSDISDAELIMKVDGLLAKIHQDILPNAELSRLIALARIGAAVKPVMNDIITERRRQITNEGWSEAHDDSHHAGEMALAAACYAAPERMFKAEQLAGRDYEPFTAYRDAWPWADKWWKPKDRRRDLVRAGALIVAEIERLDRALPSPKEKI